MIEVEHVLSSALYTATLVSLPCLADNIGEVLTLAGCGLSYRSFRPIAGITPWNHRTLVPGDPPVSMSGSIGEVEIIGAEVPIQMRSATGLMAITVILRMTSFQPTRN